MDQRETSYYTDHLAEGAEVNRAEAIQQPSPTLTHADHCRIVPYLQQLTVQELINVGVKLGLQYSKLKNLSPECILNDMVHAWLRKDDCVIKTTGEPSWKSLTEALRDCGHEGIAQMIEKGAILP